MRFDPRDVPELLATVRARFGRLRWHRDEWKIDRFTRRKLWIRKPRRPNPEDPEKRAESLKWIRQNRSILGPRWTNPVAWAAALNLITFEEATELTIARKMEESRARESGRSQRT